MIRTRLPFVLLVALAACKPDPDDTGDDDTGGDDTGDSGEETGDTDTDTGGDTDTGDTGDTSDTADTSGTDTEDVGPYVVSIDPPDGAAGVPLGAVITVTFSEPVINTTVGASTFTLAGPLGFVGASRTVGPTTAVLDPSLDLAEFAREYTVTLEAGITDVDGNPLTETTSTFRTVPTDPRYWYQLIPFAERLAANPGVIPVLGVGASPFACAVLTSADSKAQQWRTLASGALENNADGAPDPNSLDGALCTLADATSLSADETWTLAFDSECTQAGGTRTCPTDGVGTHFNGLWRLHTTTAGTAKSLDVQGTVTMADSADVTHQLFQLRRHCFVDCQ